MRGLPPWSVPAGKGWVVDGDDDGSGELVGRDALEGGGEEGGLASVEDGVGSGGAGLGGDDAGVFEDVAIDAEDSNERRVEGEVHPGLDHGGAAEAAGVGVVRGRWGAEVGEEAGEAGGASGSLGVDDAVVVAGDGEDGGHVVTERLVELVVVVGGFAEVIDEVAEVVEEAGDVGGVGLGEVGDHLVGDEALGGGAGDAAGVADGVEDDLAGLGDGGLFGGAGGAVDLREGEGGLNGETGGVGWEGFELEDFRPPCRCRAWRKRSGRARAWGAFRWAGGRCSWWSPVSGRSRSLGGRAGYRFRVRHAGKYWTIGRPGRWVDVSLSRFFEQRVHLREIWHRDLGMGGWVEAWPRRTGRAAGPVARSART